MMRSWKLCQRWLAAGLVLAVFTLAGPVASAEPEQANTSGRLAREISPIMEQAIKDGSIPGGVVLVGHDGEVVYRQAFGMRSLEPAREQMTTDTIFDLASLTKCIATTTAVMQLVESGRIRLNDAVALYLPEFAQNGKQDITIRELLTHFSGLRPDLDLNDPWLGRDAAFRLAMAEKPAQPPGSHFVYSDINFETLGFLVERVSGTPLNEYAQTHIFSPLGMKDTRFLPLPSSIARIAPTQYDEHNQMLRGVVHDPTARRMDGVAGHAGLFSSADDLSRFAEDLLSGFHVLSRPAVAKMSTPQQPATAASLRGLGWDIDSPFSANRGELLPVGSFGHTGFTGTSLWIDPTTHSYVILLTSAVHPRGGKSITSLRSRIANAVISSFPLSPSESSQLALARITGYNESLMAARRLATRNGNVRNGIDVLESHAFRELHPSPDKPIRVGLVTNQTAVDQAGQRTADALAHAAGIRLTAIFSPEHGLAGTFDTTTIHNSTDEATGVPIYSVYGKTDAQRRPQPEALSGLDVIVFDIQDAGVRFYTYESTLGYFLEAAAKAGKEIVVLDRPNPINGVYVQGPVADPERASFVSYWQTPVRHGMTMGELSKMFNAERSIAAKLTVIPMEGWLRGDWFDATGNLWINPSPNMRSLTEAILYPGIGMIEGTNVSVGRGTDTPFEVVGAPWINPMILARYLNERQLEGVRFLPIRFTPSASTYAQEVCGGVNIMLNDRDALDGPELGAEIASALHTLYPDKYHLELLDTLMRNKSSLDALTAGEDPRRIADEWRDRLNAFVAIRAKYLLY